MKYCGLQFQFPIHNQSCNLRINRKPSNTAESPYGAMKRTAILIIGLLVCMSMQAIMAEYAGIPAPNDNHGNEDTLSIDGSVITKLVSVGGDVEVLSLIHI